MKPERAKSGTQLVENGLSDELKQELERERSARQRALAYSKSLERVLEALTTFNLEQLLPRLLGVFVEHAGAAGGALWLRDGESLRLSTAVGVSGDSARRRQRASGRNFRVAGGGPALTLPVSLLPSDHPLLSYLPAEEPSLCVRLGDPRALLAVVCLSGRALGSIEEETRDDLTRLAEYAAAALGEQVAREGLLRSLQSRDEILGIVAHDLRNPLNVITAASSSLHQRLPDSLSRRPVERIMRAAQRAEHLIRDLLDIYAIESGHFSIEKQELDSTSTILSAVESQQGLAASSSVILATDLSPELPAIDADEERILEVLENLLGNAVKFTPAGGSVTVGASAHAAEVTIWVQDNGPGLSPDQQSHLFDRFWQGTKGDRRGAGLGLTICRAIVEAHGGRIWAESSSGEGTTVFFTVPTRGRAPAASRHRGREYLASR